MGILPSGVRGRPLLCSIGEGSLEVVRDPPPAAACRPKERTYHRLIEAEIIDPTRIPPAKREIVFRRLYRVHQQIFAGVPIESFITYLVRPDAIRTRIQIYRNETGGVVVRFISS